MKVYIDVSNLIKVSFVTGIQRVVREVVLRLLKREDLDIILMNYNEEYNIFEQVDVDRFVLCFEDNIGDKEQLITGKGIDLENLQPEDVFFDIDSVWNLPLRRSVLLPKLKRRGVRLVVYVYDIIPITHPQYCHGQTIYKFMNYIGAYLQYADLIMASAQSTLDAIDELLKQLGLPSIPGVVSWLGADFNIQISEEEEIAPEAVEAAETGRYVLMVGTIEPRKNHALVLDAFDHKLFEQGLNLVFVGRTGWNVEALQNRIDQHRLLKKQLFHLKGMNDATVDYLYKHAYCVAFPTYNEGFGLPIIEAFQRGTPVLASDIPILREVGGDYCDYFDLTSWKSFADALRSWIDHPEQYEERKDKIRTYEPVTWDAVADTIGDALLSIKKESPYPIPDRIRQMVYLTARVDDLLAALPFVEHFMPFIEELVLCCPDTFPDQMREKYQGRLKLLFLTDSELLAGEPLPEDHAMRNFFLRCQAMKSEKLDDVFIMADDDYRPLYPLSQSVYLDNGKYQGYYCYSLGEWKGDQSTPTSFDQSMFRTRDFLEEHGLASLMFDSHMPQVIDRRIFQEILQRFPNIKTKGYSDWSIYFNYLTTYYPEIIANRPYATLAWPGTPSGWDMTVHPEQLLFENYYSELYDDGEIFEGFSRTYYDGIEHENMEKVVRYMNLQADHDYARMVYRTYCENYEMQYGEVPMFYLNLAEDDCVIMIPRYVMICELNFTRIPIIAETSIQTDGMYELSYRILDYQDLVLLDGDCMSVPVSQEKYELAIKGIYGGIKGILEITVRYHEREYKGFTKLFVIKKGI